MKTTIDIYEAVGHAIFLGYKINYYNSKEDPLFLARDIAKIVGYSISAMRAFTKSSDESEVRTIYTAENSRGFCTKQFAFTEKGLYQAIGRRKCKLSEKFYNELCEMMVNPDKVLLKIS